jgi:two-component system, chemotaxis family, sensor kinase CheA
LRELIRLREGRSSPKIEFIRSAAVYRLRGSLLPLVFLDQELGLEPAPKDSECHIAVLRFGTRSFGLVVDNIVDFQEVVVKPLGRHLKGIPLYAGSTLMGDGRPALILDMSGLALSAHIALGGETSAETNLPPTIPVSRPESMALVFQTPDDGRMVIPMDHVVRLEVFHRSAVERAGSMDALQYEGRVLPLIHVSKILPERRLVARNPSTAMDDDEKMQVVIYSENSRWVGLVVDKVIDILTVTALEAERPAGRAGVLGTLILGGRVTEMLDVPGAIRYLDTGSWKQTAEKQL